MSQHIDGTRPETPPSPVRVHILGAGPVGLLLTASPQFSERFFVRLYEKRRDYTRTRMVQLASYPVADSVTSRPGSAASNNFAHVAASMDRFIAKVHEETNGEIVGRYERYAYKQWLRAHAQQDDQTQQGLAGACRRHVCAAGKTARLLRPTGRVIVDSNRERRDTGKSGTARWQRRTL